jgi:Ca2+-binding EF-hand superfamily protein
MLNNFNLLIKELQKIVLHTSIIKNKLKTINYTDLTEATEITEIPEKTEAKTFAVDNWDIDDDGVIDGDDVAELLELLVADVEIPQTDEFDVDGSGKLDVLDLQLILQTLVGVNSKEGDWSKVPSYVFEKGEKPKATLSVLILSAKAISVAENAQKAKEYAVVLEKMIDVINSSSLSKKDKDSVLATFQTGLDALKEKVYVYEISGKLLSETLDTICTKTVANVLKNIDISEFA